MAKDGMLELQAPLVGGVLSRSLRFCAIGAESIAHSLEALWGEGRRRFVLRGEPHEIEMLAQRLQAAHPELQRCADAEVAPVRLDCVYLYAGLEAEDLAGALMAHLDDSNSAILAPRGEMHWSKLPLFLISIPKSGTHLLYELARALGYRDGIICPDSPFGGTWYCIEYSNSHTRAADFLIDSTRRAAFGNKHHPFFRSPALFIYRNPRDILISESNWFHKSSNSPLAGYLSDLSDDERLLRLVDDPWLLGSIRDRVGGFIPWLSFPNVIPLSFEEIVGGRGGGSDAAQLDLIWALQLKLQADGNPEDIASKVFNLDSPTFSEGRVGGWLRRATPQVKEEFARLPTDFLEIYGYAEESAQDAASLPARAAEFRRRRLRLAGADFSGTPILIETDYLAHNIVRLGSRFYAVPQAAGHVSLERLSRHRFVGLVRARSLAALKAEVMRRHRLVPRLLGKLWHKLARSLRGRRAGQRLRA